MPRPRPRRRSARKPGNARREYSAGGVVTRRATDGTVYFLVIRDSYRNWGFPKGHIEQGETAAIAAEREVGEETGLDALRLIAPIETIEWFFRFKGRLVHKVCHFFLFDTSSEATVPQRDEGITACKWAPFSEAISLVSYDNARSVLTRANQLLVEPGGS